MFLEDLSILIASIIGIEKPIKEFAQRERFKSYQLYLNKKEKNLLLGMMPKNAAVRQWYSDGLENRFPSGYPGSIPGSGVHKNDRS